MLNSKEKTLLLDCIDDGRETCLRGIRRYLIEKENITDMDSVMQQYEDRIKEIQELKIKIMEQCV